MESSKALAVNSSEEKGPEYFVRFSIRQRVEHITLMLIFVALAVTGLVQRYYTAGFSEWVIMGLGGIEATRLVHRILGLVFTLSMLYHFGFIIYAYLFKHFKPAIMPNLKDFRDIVTEVKHGLGFKVERPQFHRYDYRQKFEYLGLMFGSVVLIVSGFVLMYPILITRVLPGQVVAAALVFHGYEATLAVLTILIWHLYDVILKPGIFPADTSIFTGRISRKRLAEEHYLEYPSVVNQRNGTLFKPNTLDNQAASTSSPRPRL